TDGSKWQTACNQLRASKLEPAAAAYKTYALALADWWTKSASDAATILFPLVKEPNLPEVLSNAPFRKEKASRILRGALGSLQRGGTFTQPFKNDKGADTAAEAYDLLMAA